MTKHTGDTFTSFIIQCAFEKQQTQAPLALQGIYRVLFVYICTLSDDTLYMVHVNHHAVATWLLTYALHRNDIECPCLSQCAL